MKLEKRRVKYVERRRFNDGLGKSFRIHVTVMAEEYTDPETGKTDLIFDMVAMNKIESAIKKKYPDWFHVCFINRDGIRTVSKENCPACKRNQLRKERGLT